MQALFLINFGCIPSEPTEVFFCNIEAFIKAEHIRIYDCSSNGDIFGRRTYSFEGYRSLDSIFNDVVTKQREELKETLTCVVAKDLYPYVFLDKENPDYVKSVFMVYLGFYGEDTPEVRKAKEMKQRMEAAGYYLPNGSIIRLAFNSESPVNKVYVGTPADELYKWEFRQRLLDIGRFRTNRGFEISNYGTKLFLKLTGKKPADFPLPNASLPSFVKCYCYPEMINGIRESYMAEYILKAEGFEFDREAFVKKFYYGLFITLGAYNKNEDENKIAEIKKAFDDYESVFYADLIPPIHNPYMNLNDGDRIFALRDLRMAGYQVSDILYIPRLDRFTQNTYLTEVKTKECISKGSDGSYSIASSYDERRYVGHSISCYGLPDLYSKLLEFQKSALKNVNDDVLYNHLGLNKGDLPDRASLESAFVVSLGFDDGSSEAAKANEIKKFLTNSGYNVSSNNIANIAFNSNSPANTKSNYTADELYQWVCLYNNFSRLQKSNVENSKGVMVYNHLGVNKNNISDSEPLGSAFVASLGLKCDSPEADTAIKVTELLRGSGYNLSGNNIVRIASSSDSPINNKNSEQSADEIYQWACIKRYYDFQDNLYQKSTELDRIFTCLSGLSVSTIPLPDDVEGDRIRDLYEIDYVLKSEGLEAIKFYSSEFTNTEERKKVFEDYACVFYGAINSANQ